MKKMQQGGVYDVNAPTIPVGDIPVYNSPQLPDLLQLNGPEMLRLAQHVQSKAIQERNNELAEMRYQDALVESTLKLQDKLFGPVHTEKQKQTLEEIRAEYNIPENFDSSILDNPFLLKDMRRNLQMASLDRRFQQLAVDVARGEEYRKTAETKLIGDDFVEWNDSAWKKYLSGEATLDDVSPAKFRPKTKTSPEEFQAITNRILDKSMGVDFNNPESVANMEAIALQGYLEKNPEEAIARGLVVQNPDGTVTLSEATRKSLHQGIKFAQSDFQARQDASIDKYSTQRAIADAYADGNRAAKTESGKTLEDIESLIHTMELTEKIDLPRGNADVELLIRAYYSAGTAEERANILDAIKEYANGSSPVGKKQVNLYTSEADFSNRGLAPKVGLPSPPQPSLKELMKQNGL